MILKFMEIFTNYRLFNNSDGMWYHHWYEFKWWHCWASMFRKRIWLKKYEFICFWYLLFQNLIWSERFQWFEILSEKFLEKIVTWTIYEYRRRFVSIAKLKLQYNPYSRQKKYKKTWFIILLNLVYWGFSQFFFSRFCYYLRIKAI